jgi:hypothetical protein
MGGFVVDVRDMHDDLTHLTVTPKLIIDLAQRGHYLTPMKKYITDKSKADVLAKALVCFQVLWLLVQCFARKIAGYPISLLEPFVSRLVCIDDVWLVVQGKLSLRCL